jgi:hypothetical protein
VRWVMALCVALLATSCGTKHDTTSGESGLSAEARGYALLEELNHVPDIQSLKRLGVVQDLKLAGGGLLGVVVGPGFDRLSFVEKQGAMGMISKAVREERGGSAFELYDWRTDKQVGKFTTWDGLKLR